MMPPEPSGSWQPLLTGRLREEAGTAVRAIAAALRAPSPVPASATSVEPGEPELDAAPPFGPSLAGGHAGIALFHAYRSLAADDENEPEGDALDHLECAIDALGEFVTPPSLYSGYPGVAWTAAHLASRLDVAAADATAEVDAALAEHLAAAALPAPFDLLDGWVGLGVYALERLPDAAGSALLAGAVDRLAEVSEIDAPGITWFSAPATFPEQDRETFPNGYYNLGVAHGVPGVIALLARASAAGVRSEVARRLLAGAVEWLLARRLPGEGALFAYHHRSGRPPQEARLAWCYGDAGIAVALLGAARALGEPRWEQAAREIAVRAAGRDPASARVVDAGLCHGACGLGHLFNRLYQATGDKLLGDAARRWFKSGLAMRRPGTGVGGFSALLPGPDGMPSVPIAEPGFLLGATGIGLALLAATSTIEPAWDRVLLADLAPAAGRP